MRAGIVLVDPDLGRALSGGYHRPPAHVTPGPPADPWPCHTRVRAAIIRTLAETGAVLTSEQLADRIGLNRAQRNQYLRPALVTLARRSLVEQVTGMPGPCSWRLSRPS